MRKWHLILLTVLALSGCKDYVWQTSEISGAMPPLEFELQDEDGRIVTAADYRGGPALLFFGFANCPDVCPTTLAVLAEATQRLDENIREDLKVLFVSVDPERDDLEILARYTDAFGPQFIGLSGDKQALIVLTRRYGSTYSYSKKDNDGSYDVSHSSAVLAFDRGGQVRLLIRADDPIDAIAADLRHLIIEG